MESFKGTDQSAVANYCVSARKRGVFPGQPQPLRR